MNRIIVRLIGYFLQVICIITLPFFLLIRGSIYVYTHYGYATWLCFLIGFLASILVITLYISIIYRRFFGKITIKSFKRKLLLSLVIVLSYCIYATVQLSNKHTKTSEVHKEFARLHPFLKLSVATLVLLDKKLLITDLSRQPEDYKKMGLKTIKNSLHYVQGDGYVHAMDLRTKGRNEVRNFLLKLYFCSMGFNTLRHSGTADHLHISLYSPYMSWAI